MHLLLEQWVLQVLPSLCGNCSLHLNGEMILSNADIKIHIIQVITSLLHYVIPEAFLTFSSTILSSTSSEDLALMVTWAP